MTNEQCALENLANAIVIQAFNDYVVALKKNNTKKIREIEKFIGSPAYELYTDVDPQILIRHARVVKNKKWNHARYSNEIVLDKNVVRRSRHVDRNPSVWIIEVEYTPYL